MSVHKISRTNELMYYVTTVAKSPCNTVLITVLPGALFLFRSNYFYRYSILFLSDNNLIQMPDIIYILLDGAVRGEFTAACGIQKCHLRPLLLILISCLHSLLSLSIGSEVSENEILVCSGAVLSVQKRIKEISEQL